MLFKFRDIIRNHSSERLMAMTIIYIQMERRAPRKDKERGECQISGCREEASRSIPAKKLKDILSVSIKQEARRVHICKKHYRQFRKKTKQDRTLERLGW